MAEDFNLEEYLSIKHGRNNPTGCFSVPRSRIRLKGVFAQNIPTIENRQETWEDSKFGVKHEIIWPGVCSIWFQAQEDPFGRMQSTGNNKDL